LKKYSLEIGKDTISVTLNKFAKQADSSVMLTCHDTSVLTTVVASKKEHTMNFFPLIINYEEKLYAAGKIPSNFSRREGRPLDEATLNARLIDRTLRPLFPEEYKQEVQIVNTVMSYEEGTHPDILGIIGSSLTLSLAEDIPFQGPVAGVKVGLIDGEFVLNPPKEELQNSELELLVSGTYEAINMVEAGANEVEESIIIDAILFAHDEIKKITTWIKEIVKDQGKITKEFNYEYSERYLELYEEIKKQSEIYEKSLVIILKEERNEALKEILQNINESHIEEEDQEIIKEIHERMIYETFRKLIIKDKVRVDGRRLDEIRKLDSELDILPRVHGNAMFTRGETQVMASVTLGVKQDEQLISGLEDDYGKGFFLHYNFPPYSVGEAGRIGAPGRREIGHGTLAEKSFKHLIPSESEFPYTIRVVAEVLESNGSSSQATICSSSLALMAAGVPLKKQVAGIAMGLVADGDEYTILTDIQGFEDHYGDMDFKVAGTDKGICAIQMDIKVKGISRSILEESLEQAKKARLEILDNMNQVISEPRVELSKFAPKIEKMKIEVSQIKDVIGKGGETINKIIEETGVKIDILEDGTVLIFGVDPEMIKKTIKIISDITKVYKKGEQYKAKVVRIESYGAFVRIDSKTDALLHISDLSDKRVEKVEDVIKLEQDILVEIKEVDSKKRIKVKLVTEDK